MSSSATDLRESIRQATLAVDRLADRLRTLSDTRLARPMPSPSTLSRADAAHALAQALADAAAVLEASDSGVAPAHRQVPRLDDFAVGDQVAVTGHDLVAAAAARMSEPALASEPAAVSDALFSAAEACRALLRDL